MEQYRRWSGERNVASPNVRRSPRPEIRGARETDSNGMVLQKSLLLKRPRIGSRNGTCFKVIANMIIICKLRYRQLIKESPGAGMAVAVDDASYFQPVVAGREQRVNK